MARSVGVDEAAGGLEEGVVDAFADAEAYAAAESGEAAFVAPEEGAECCAVQGAATGRWLGGWGVVGPCRGRGRGRIRGRR